MADIAGTGSTLEEYPVNHGQPGAGGGVLDNSVTLQALKGWLDTQYTTCKNARYRREKQWYYNMSFYRGKQYLQLINTATNEMGYRFVQTKAPPWRVRLTVNKVRTIVRTEIAKLTSSRPTFTVSPKTTEDEDQAAARLATQLFENVYYEDDMLEKMTETIFWMSVTGTSFIKCYWDQSSSYGGQQGEICLDPIDPFHIYVPDWRQNNLEKQPYLIHVTTLSKDQVRFKYGKEIGDKATTVSSTDTPDQLLMNIDGSEKQVIKEQVLIKEYWIKPKFCPYLPNGGVVTLVGDVMISEPQPWPYIHNKYPFVVFRHIPTGEFYGESVITDLIDLQREYNRTVSQIVEDKNQMGRPKITAQKGAIDPNKITGEPGQVILYNPGYEKPGTLDIPPIPQYIADHLVRIQNDIDDISGQHEISRGNVPSEVTAATAISFLQEQDDTKLNPTTHSIESALQNLGSQYLKLVVQYWDVPRLVESAGKDQTFNAQFVQGSALQGHTDVRVEAGSAMPYSKAAKQAFVMDLMKFGVIQPQDVLQVLELRGIEKAQEQYLVDYNQVVRENVKMSHGVPADVSSWDNHQVHVNFHNNFRKTQEFEALDDQVKMIFEQHVRTHEMQVQQAQMAQMQMQPGQEPNGPTNSASPPSPGGAPGQGPQEGPSEPPGGPVGGPEGNPMGGLPIG